jgi:6-pyruvoyltetrahydropterin/6-carboxytetrahydropterin synthase
MPTVFLSRSYWFSAAHRLNSGDLNSEENVALYDKCNNYNGHGHDYKLEVSIKGIPDGKTGMIIPLTIFDERVKKVLNLLDYKHLNREVSFFKNRLSSGEIIIQYLWKNLEKEFSNHMLKHLKLWETNNNYFELGQME